MRKKLCAVIMLILMFHAYAVSQNNVQPRDTTGTLPQLEIPEITIVGKKAIMLPFARKGEIFDVSIYDAPPPDTSLLGTRDGISLPVGSLPRYEEHQQPWRASLEGSFGNFTTGKLRGYVDYATQQWGIFGNGGFSTTQGHTENASGNTAQFEVNARSLVSTDNDILKMFRASAGLSFLQERFGMFGISNASVRRNRSNVGLSASIGSVNRQGNVLDVTIATKVWNVTDSQTAGDSNVSAVSPDLRATFSSDVNSMRLSTEIFYTGSSLEYQHQTQSPSLFGLSAGVRWHVSETWYIHVGGLYHGASDIDGSSKSLVAPRAIVMWEAGGGREWSFWFQPEIHLASYDEQIRRNPYLVREVAIRPERKPLNFGSTLTYKSDMLSLELNGSFSHSELRDVEIADSGNIVLDYLDANQFIFQGEGIISPTTRTRLLFSGTLQPAREAGSSIQLPMVPIVTAHVRGEMDFDLPLTMWSSINYTSRRNVDKAGNQTLGDFVLIGAGALTRSIARTVLSLEIANLFNTTYEWWNGYIAPGRRITLEAKLNLQ
jgi:hypothetical protein